MTVPADTKCDWRSDASIAPRYLFYFSCRVRRRFLSVSWWKRLSASIWRSFSFHWKKNNSFACGTELYRCLSGCKTHWRIYIWRSNGCQPSSVYLGIIIKRVGQPETAVMYTTCDVWASKIPLACHLIAAVGTWYAPMCFASAKVAVRFCRSGKSCFFRNFRIQRETLYDLYHRRKKCFLTTQQLTGWC